MNQIKLNQINHKKRLHNMGLTSMQISWNHFYSIYQQYSILISIEHLLNESSRLTVWNRFGISNYHPYSLFRSTYPCHKNKDNRNYILRIANGCSIWQIHIQSFQSISIITSHCQRTGIIIPHLSPLPYSIRYHKPRISFYWFNNSIIQSFIDW